MSAAPRTIALSGTTPTLARVEWVRRPGDADDAFRMGRLGPWLVARWEGLGCLWTTADGSEVRIEPADGVDPIFVEKWRLGAVRALVRHLEGRITLHASAVALEGRALVFVGDSGAGKSTAAAHLCDRHGAALLADDLTEIDARDAGYVVNPSELSHWLSADSAEAVGRPRPSSGKAPGRALRVAERPVSVSALVVLAFSEGADEPSLTPLRGAAAFAAINSSYVRFVLDDPQVTRADLHSVGDLVEAVPVLQLTRPHSFAALEATAALFSATRSDAAR